MIIHTSDFNYFWMDRPLTLYADDGRRRRDEDDIRNGGNNNCVLVTTMAAIKWPPSFDDCGDQVVPLQEITPQSIHPANFTENHKYKCKHDGRWFVVD